MPKGTLKALQGERIIFTLGTITEIRLVRRIFRLYVRHGMKPRAIAERFNKDGHRGPNGRPWRAQTIYAMIDNEEYTGTSLFNVTTRPLGGKQRRSSRENVLRVPNAFPAIISPGLFAAAQLVRHDRRRWFPDEQELLARLEYLLAKNGRLSAPIIAADRRGGTTDLYRRRFGSLLQAYARIGYVPPPTDTSSSEWSRRSWAFTRSLRMRIFNIAEAGGAKVRRPRYAGGVFSINHLRLTVSAAHYLPSPGLRRPGWLLLNRRRHLPDHMVIARMDGRNEDAVEYFLLRADTIGRRRIKYGDEQFASWAGYRYETFGHLMDAIMMRATA
jgi:hypothetical protein